MHREIQIKQIPIVTTHDGLRHETSGLCEKTNSIYIVFLPLVHNHVQVIWVRTHIRWRLTEGVSEAWCWCAVIVTTNQSHTSLVLHERDWVFAWGDLIGWRRRWRLKSCVSTTLQTRPPSSVDADAPCECSVSQSARTHMSHTGCVCALRSLGHGCVQEVKNDINTVRFLTQTARFVS